ncbi:hypothetical protein J4460_01670 [Candidatus Woesearchaeota archaeon]|nr:MAG: hypothetical protein QS99_C0003G0013 [archaeon GW2011_AR4]MBS3129359.1 hypothetical protein [Candidatus Woesearchaeota archaeon]HIH37610.1 hypothetical protein [Candidatus Woesearchaeota archaeon]HIH48773.1 hypothetical protein [Candidatus Woesearchaeota archaeon]HIJ03583.1 hypothetical protein [Candidatus Woesearchaeota archaeon]
MRVEHHLRNLKESLEEVEAAVEKGVLLRQRTIGFHTSAACVDMLEIYLHKKNLIPLSFILKHEWFASKNKIQEKVSFPFSRKDEILSLISKVELKRNILCYGKQQPEQDIEELLHHFNSLRNIMEELGVFDE